jgi:hypothetical protein
MQLAQPSAARLAHRGRVPINLGPP